jgi:hypothetical protein
MNALLTLIFLIFAILPSYSVLLQINAPNANIEGLLKLKDIIRTIDGSANNLAHPNWGKSYTNLIRKTPVRYEDGKSQPLKNLPNPRFLSEAISKL